MCDSVKFAGCACGRFSAAGRKLAPNCGLARADAASGMQKAWRWKARYRDVGRALFDRIETEGRDAVEPMLREQGTPYLVWVGSLRNGTDGGNA
jgi:hypothetical protein